MPTPQALQVVDPEDFAQELVLILALLSTSNKEQPVWRWLEYQAYNGFTSYVIAKNQLPANFELFKPSTESIREWIAGKGSLPKSFIAELKRLLVAMKGAGGDIFDDLCRFYCEYKAKLKIGAEAGSLLLTIAQIKALVVAYTGDALFFGGIPITAFVALIINLKLLDGICDCS